VSRAEGLISIKKETVSWKKKKSEGTYATYLPFFWGMLSADRCWGGGEEPNSYTHTWNGFDRPLLYWGGGCTETVCDVGKRGGSFLDSFGALNTGGGEAATRKRATKTKQNAEEILSIHKPAHRRKELQIRSHIYEGRAPYDSENQMPTILALIQTTGCFWFNVTWFGPRRHKQRGKTEGPNPYAMGVLTRHRGERKKGVPDHVVRKSKLKANQRKVIDFRNFVARKNRVSIPTRNAPTSGEKTDGRNKNLAFGRASGVEPL